MARHPPQQIPRHLQTAGIGAIRAEIARRERHLAVLMRRRAAIQKELSDVEAALRGQGEAYSPQPRNEQNLIEALRAVLAGKTLSVRGAAEAVRAAGYHTNAAHFRVMVNAALLKKKFFKRVGRGMYTGV